MRHGFIYGVIRDKRVSLILFYSSGENSDTKVVGVFDATVSDGGELERGKFRKAV